MINLLHNDGQLLATKIIPFTIYNITNQLDGHIIKKIIYNNDRLIILTKTKLYNLYFVETDFQLDDITDDVNQSVNIDDIINVNMDDYGDHFCIVTQTNLVFLVTFEMHNLKSINSMLNGPIGNIVATSNKIMGLLFEQDDGSYLVAQFGDM